MKTAFFDLETLRLFKDVGGDTSEHAKKLGISVGGVAINDGDVTIFQENEVSDLISALKTADIIVGHNVLRFDYFVMAPYTKNETINLLRGKTIDTLDKLSSLRNGFRKGLSLDTLAQLNLGIKKDLLGIMMPGLWHNGEHEKVKKHLEDDVKITRDLYNYIKQGKKVKYEHFDYGESKGTRELKIPNNLLNL